MCPGARRPSSPSPLWYVLFGLSYIRDLPNHAPHPVPAYKWCPSPHESHHLWSCLSRPQTSVSRFSHSQRLCFRQLQSSRTRSSSHQHNLGSWNDGVFIPPIPTPSAWASRLHLGRFLPRTRGPTARPWRIPPKQTIIYLYPHSRLVTSLTYIYNMQVVANNSS